MRPNPNARDNVSKSKLDLRPWFNEVHDDEGNVRTHYKASYAVWQSLPGPKRKILLRQSKKLYLGDYSQDLLPRIITRSEFFFLRQGVEQRARAIREFLHDYYARGRKWTRIIPPRTLNAIIGRNHEESVLGRLDPKTIAFQFGPDIIRDSQGNWKIVEDSTGTIGGVGDLVQGRDILFKLIPSFRKLFKDSNNPKEFYLELAEHFQRKAKEHGGIALTYIAPQKYRGDHEPQRLGEVFESAGIAWTSPDDKTKCLIIDETGVHLQTPRKKTRVGYLIFYSAPETMDLSQSAWALNFLCRQKRAKGTPAYTHACQQLSQALKGNTIRAALLKKCVLSNFSPGVQFVNDKMFGLFVDRLIRSYLKEEPILRSIPTHSLAFRNQVGEWSVDKKILKHLIQRKDQFVLKRVDEDGGSGVWIGNKLSQKEFEKQIVFIKKEPEKYVFQEFQHLSVLENRIVDLRIHAHVDRENILISNTPWGRANWIEDDGKVNLSSNGFSSPVVVTS
jgi:uncharacterized circularly permuted ATP-grasp superfamily protein